MPRYIGSSCSAQSRALLVSVYTPVTPHWTMFQALPHSLAQNLTRLPFVGDLCLRRWLVRFAFGVNPETVKYPMKKNKKKNSPSLSHPNFLYFYYHFFFFWCISSHYFGGFSQYMIRLFKNGCFSFLTQISQPCGKLVANFGKTTIFEKTQFVLNLASGSRSLLRI